MTDINDKADDVTTRRSMLRLGAGIVPVALTLRASPASATTSVLECRVPFTQTPYFRVNGVDKWITSSGTLVDKPSSYNATNGPFPPLAAGGYYEGKDLQARYKGTGSMPTGKAMNYGSYTTNSKAAEAHYNYLYNNAQNSSAPGYTCLMSIASSV